MKKKQKGFTLIEVMVSSILTIIISIGLFQLAINTENRENIDELAYTAAQTMYLLSSPAQKYIEDNMVSGIPDSFDKQLLIEKGYLENNQDVNVDKMPLGRTLKFYANNEYGFPLSIGMYQTGEINEEILKRYKLDIPINMINYEFKVANYLSQMLKNDNFKIGVINENYEMKEVNSSQYFDLNPFIKHTNTEVSNQYSTVLFFSLQERPGYWVLNFNSTAFVNTEEAEGNPRNKLYSIGYSDFCANPAIIPEDSIDNDPLVEIYQKDISSGNSVRNVYVCLPAPKTSVEETNYEIPLINQFYKDLAYKDGCVIRNTYANVVEFKIGNRYYTFQTTSGREMKHCYHDWQPTYHNYKIDNGQFTGDKRNILMKFNNLYQPTIPNVTINRVVLK